jgi:hypothetical protein
VAVAHYYNRRGPSGGCSLLRRRCHAAQGICSSLTLHDQSKSGLCQGRGPLGDPLIPLVSRRRRIGYDAECSVRNVQIKHSNGRFLRGRPCCASGPSTLLISSSDPTPQNRGFPDLRSAMIGVMLGK